MWYTFCCAMPQCIKDILMFILEIVITCNASTRSIPLSQKAYLPQVLECFKMTNCNPQYTPLLSGTIFMNNIAPRNDTEQAFMSDKSYRQLLGALMWAQATTRLNLSFAVTLLTHFQSNPRPAHWKALVHILIYVKGTFNYWITYSREMNGTIKLWEFIDADYRGDLDMRRLTSGYIFMMVKGPISWSSKHQQMVVLSMTEAEYIAMMHRSQ